MNKKKILISLVMTSLLFTACGGGGDDTAPPVEEPVADLTFVTSTDVMNVMEGEMKSMRLNMGTNLLDLGAYVYDFKVTDKSTNVTYAVVDQSGVLLFSAPNEAGETFTITVTATDNNTKGTGSVTLNFATVDGSNLTPRTIIKTGADDGGFGEDRTFQKDIENNVAGVNDLIWADRFANVPTDVTGKTYLEAKDWCEITAKGIDGKDWRLPTINELLDTVNYSKVVNNGIMVYDAFEMELLTSWSENLNDREYYLHNRTATIIENNDNKFMTRCVWGDKEISDHVVYIGGDMGDTYDLSTGLQWSPATTATTMAVAGDVAKDFCENREYNGHNDWRLPNINELRSIVENGSISSSITTGAQLISGTPYNDGNDSTSLNWGIYLNADVTTSVAQMFTVSPTADAEGNYQDMSYPITCVRPIN